MWYYMYPEVNAVSDFPFFLRSIGLHELQPHIIRPTGYEYDQFFYNAKGFGKLIMNGKSFDLPAHCGFFIPAGIPHEYYPLSDTWDVRWMFPDGDSLSKLYVKLGLSKGGVFSLESINNLDVLLNKMREDLLDNKVFGNYYASSHVQEFILEFAKQAGLMSEPNSTVSDIQSTYQKHMNILEDYVEYHFMTPISSSELSDLIGLSPQHMCRIFRTCTGMTPIEYINSVRVQKAKEMLILSSHPVWKIGEFCGFENSNYFCRIFKRMTGTSPGEYRKNRKAATFTTS